MAEASVLSNRRARAWKRVQKYVSGGAAAALLAGMLVVAGVGVQSALAAPAAPTVTTAPTNPPLVAGEAGSVTVSFRNGSEGIGPYNLSATLLLPVGVKVTDSGALGAPTKTYTNADGALPGAYPTTPGYCATLGLQPVPAAVGKCQVPEGWQLFVYENISDLPASAANSTSVTVLPDAELFEPGSKIPYTFIGFTSENPNLIPVFPGSSSKAANATHTSAPGIESSEIAVEALRIEKSEPSPERELLRGVHDHQTVYTLRIPHTGEGDVSNAKVVDYLPAGLEYLGSGQADNTESANGNDDGIDIEYPNAGRMSGITQQPTNWREEESIVTVRGGFDSNGKFVENASGDVYTKVTWDLDTLLAAAPGAAPQDFAAGTPGVPGVLELQYVAGIPLFENSYVEGSFDEAVDGTHGELGQGANLDNNTGPSTRHGKTLDAAENGNALNHWGANTLTNTAVVSGDYTLQHPQDPDATVHSSSATGSVTIEAVDVRLVKSVDDSAFKQGGLATYTLNIATSEYVSAQLASEAGPSSEVRPNRLVDDLADGICPVFPAGVAVTPGASMQAGIPNLRIGNPNEGISPDDSNLSAAAWNDRLGIASECAFPSTTAGAKLENATLTGIAYDPTSGHFFLDLWINDLEPNSSVKVNYTALQSTAYSEGDGKVGATSSGDRVANSAEILMTTSPTADTASVSNGAGVGVGGEYRASEDSQAFLEARTGGLKKYVLPRSEGAKSATEIVAVPDGDWADDLAPEPFAEGDEVWYKIVLAAPGHAEVRNPVLSDYLPAGVELPAGWPNAVDPDDVSQGYKDYAVVAPSSLNDYGDCVTDTTENAGNWLQRYTGNAGGAPTVSGKLLTWKLGSDECVAGNTSDRFLPIDSSITVYVKGVVTGTSAAATQDIPQNLAKYQQQGRIGSSGEKEIFFLRDSAEIALVTTPELVKGIERNTFAGITGLGEAGWKGVPDSSGTQNAAPDYSAGTNHTGAETVPSADNQFWSNVDGEYAVQQDEITFRIDVRSPMGNPDASVSSTNYVVWDALPLGVKAADVLQGSGKHWATAANIQWVQTFDGDSQPTGWEQRLSESPIAGSNLEFTVVDPGDAGYPTATLNSTYQGRSLVLWKLKDTAIAGSTPADPDNEHTGEINGFSLHYTVKVPSDSTNPRRDALLGQHYENTASIVQYDALTTTSVNGSKTTLVPFGNNTLRDNGDDPANLGGARAVPYEKTIDGSSFDIPNTAMKKTLVSTQIKGDGTTTPNDANNPDNVIAQGELATFDVSVRVPAHTTVREGVLADAGTLARISGGSMNPATANYQVYSAEVTERNGQAVDAVQTDPFAAHATNFTFNVKTGKLFFPQYYQNATNNDQVFTVRLVLWMKDLDASHSATSTPPVTQSADRPQIGNDALLRNTATFASKNVAGTANPQMNATADVTYREPNLAITKAADTTTDLAIGDTVTYSIAVNNSNGVKSYDNVVVDTLPAGLAVKPGSFKFGTTNVYDNATELADSGLIVASGAFAGTGGTITWNDPSKPLAQLAAVPNTVYLFYQVTITPTASAGESYRNDVAVTGYTLPSSLDADSTNRRGDRTAENHATVTAVTAEFAKGVKVSGVAGAYGASVSAPIGETVEYQVVATLEPKINYYNVRIEDTFTGSNIGTPVRAVVSGPTAAPVNSIAGTWSRDISGLKDTWTISGDHIAASDDTRTVTIVYSVKLTDAITANQLGNTAKLSWTQSEDSSSTRSSTADSTARVNILNPSVNIAKTVKFSDEADSSYRELAEGNPDRSLIYRVVVSNTAGTAAHHVTVVDCVPAGLVVDQSSLNGGAYSAATVGCPGGRVTWTNLGPIAVGGSQTLTYNATFAAASSFTSNSTGVGSPTQTNTASVTEYASFGTDGRVYTPGANGQAAISDTANSLPLFPRVTLAKSVTNGDIAYADTPFGWTLRATNTGRGAVQNIEVRDTLPANWSYTSAVTPQIRLNGSGSWVNLAAPSVSSQTLTWSEADIRAALGITVANPVLAGRNGSTTPYFEIRFSATPSQAALSSAGVTAGNGTRVPHTNTLLATAKDTRGATGNGTGSNTSYVTNQSTASAYLHSADLAITKVGASAPIHAGSTNVLGWTMTVTNNGPDTAVGTSAKPIKVTDLTSDLPAGVTVSSVTGTGWSCTAPTRDADGATAFECARTNPAETLASGASFPSIDVNVTVAADQPNVAANTIVNTATVVPGITHDPSLSNNESSDDVVIDTLADLTIAKTVVNPAPVNVGDSITWQVKAWNAGPSVSRADATHPLTVTDTIPAGLAGVTASGTASWVPTATRGGAPVADLTTLQAGDIVTWTYQGTQLPVGTQASADALTLSGTVLTSHTGAIANTATVTPRITPEPTTNPLPNSSTVTVTPGSETRIDVTKERVVSDGNGGWRSVTADDEFVAGTDISYRMTVVNNGPADARNVRVVDEVPAGLSYSAKADVSGSWTRSAGGTTSTGGPTATWDTFTLSGTIPATAPNHTRQFVVTYSTLPTVSASFTNCVEAATDNWVATDANRFDRACNDSASTRVVDLGIEKTHTGAGPFNAGTSVPYTITVTNHGPSASGGPITITDQLPLGMSYDSTVPATVAVAGGSATEITPTIDAATSRLLTWQVPIATVLNPNETIVVTLSAHIDQRVAGSVVLRNTATVTGVENEPDPTDPDAHPNTTTDEITTRTNAALTIEKTVQAGPWVAGKTIEYTLDVTNAGPSAVAASVTDVLPAGLTLVSMSGTDWNCEAVVAGSSTGTCSYLNAADTDTVTQLLHPVGDSTITVVARIAANVPPTAALPAPGLTNTATVNWSDTDGPGSDSDTEDIRVTTDADLSIVKSVITEAGGTVVADPAPETAGETVWYRLQVRNLGASDAVGPVTVTDTLPLGVTVPTTPTSVNGWVMTPGAVAQGQPQEVVFTLAGGLVADTAAATDRGIAPVIEFEANLDSAIADGTVLVNSAEVESATSDSNLANNIDDAEIEVSRSADLEITKSHPVADDHNRVVVGEALPFTIDVTNHGPSVSSGFEITDTMPIGFEVTSAVGPVLDDGGNPTGWEIVSISPTPYDETQTTAVVAAYTGVTEVGASVPSLVIDTLVHEQAFSETDGVADEVINLVEITDANEADPDLDNNEFKDPILVQPVVTLVIEKTAVGEFKVGKAGTYSITVENLGPHTDLGPITVTDQLPAGLSFRESPKLPEGATVTHENGLVTWTLKTPLGVGEKIELLLVVNVGQTAYDQPNHEITNTAVVDSESQLTEDSVLTDDAVVKVKPVDPLVVTGGDLAGGVLAAIALLVLLGGGTYLAGRRRQRARHA